MALALPGAAFCASAPTPGLPQATITIEQLSTSSLGTWTILSGENTILSSTGAGIDKTHYSFTLSSFGPTLITVVPPPGMAATMTVFRRGEVIVKNGRQQYGFDLLPNDDYRFLVQYAVTRLSSLGITSEPNGAKFRVSGPGGKSFTGQTPADFSNLPAGRYVVTYGRTSTCTQPAPRSIVLKPDQRNVVNATIACGKDVSDASVTRSNVTRRSIRQIVEEREAKPVGQKK
jgi:hypothetical protein